MQRGEFGNGCDLAAENLAEAVLFSSFDVCLEAGFAVEGHGSPAKPRDCWIEQIFDSKKLLNNDADQAPDKGTEYAFDGREKCTFLRWLPEPAGVMGGDDEYPGGGAEHDKDERKMERQCAHVILLVNKWMIELAPISIGNEIMESVSYI